MTWLYPIYLGLISRWHGSSLPPAKVWKSLAYALPYPVFLWNAYQVHNIIVLTIIFGLTATMKSAPHEAFLAAEEGAPLTEINASWLTRGADAWTFGLVARNSSVYAAVGWMLKGYLIAYPTALIVSIFDYHHGIYVQVAGVLSSAVAYGVSYRLRKVLPWLDWTQWGELLTGVNAGLGFVL